MNRPLYTTEILRLATTISHHGAIENPQIVVARRSPVCGSSISVMLDIDADGRVARFGQDVRACALGQASAALLGAHVIGTSGAELGKVNAQLADYLSGTRTIAPEWPGLDIFESARPFTARHASIRLPFEAAADAALQAQHMLQRTV